MSDIKSINELAIYDEEARKNIDILQVNKIDDIVTKDYKLVLKANETVKKEIEIPSKIKTVNNVLPDESGNIIVAANQIQEYDEYGLDKGNIHNYINHFSSESISNKNKFDEVDAQLNTIEQDVDKVENDINTRNYSVRPLSITTPDGYNQPYHPSVVYIPEGFNGYKFWMVETPFPIGSTLYRDRYECPCIHASNNGVDWVKPQGLINPIDDLTAQEIKNEDFFSDCHLIYRADLKRLECWYRISRRNDTTYSPISIPTWLLRKTSTDGITWSEREIMNNFNDVASPLYPMVRSQALVWSGTKYMMWFVDGEVAGLPVVEKDIKYSESIDGKTWSSKEKCNLWTGANPKVVPWHIDVQHADGEYKLLVYQLGRDNKGIDNLTLFASIDGKNFSFVKEIIKGSGNNVSYYQGLYRSCAVKVGTLWHVYITAENGNRAFLGLLKGSKLSALQMYDGNYNDDKQYFAKGLKVIKDIKYGANPIEVEFEIPIKLEDINGVMQTLFQMASNNTLTIGNLTHSGDIVVYGGSKRTINVDTLLPNATNSFDLGNNDKQFKNAFFKGFTSLGKFATVDRPTGCPTGAVIYDINLGKPIYWDGISSWKDFNGNIV